MNIPSSLMQSPRINLPEIKSASEYAFVALQEQVKAVEATIATGEDVLGMFASFGVQTSLTITNITLKGAFFVFEGLDDQDRSVHLIQHYTQLSLLLVKDKAKKPDRRSIGFNAEV